MKSSQVQVENHSTSNNSAFTPAVHALRHVPLPYFYLSSRGEILFTNQYGLKLTGLSLPELVNEPFDALLEDPIHEKIISLLSSIRTEPLELLLRLKTVDNGILSLKTRISLDVIGQEQSIRGMHVFVLDVRDTEQLNVDVDAVQAYHTVLAQLGMQTNFIHDFLHDLKTPLSTMATSLYLLQHGKGVEMERHISLLASQLEHVKSLIFAADDYTRVAQFDSSLNGQILALGLLAEEAANAFSYRFQEKGIMLQVKPFIHECHVVGDRRRLLQVFGNLFENAYRYTNAGSVLVSLHPDFERSLVYVIVQDTGIGIPTESIAHIFERFYRADNAKAHSEQGTGLGLSIVQQLIEQHNGKIEVFSREGVGTSVVITLPLVFV